MDAQIPPTIHMHIGRLVRNITRRARVPIPQATPAASHRDEVSRPCIHHEPSPQVARGYARAAASTDAYTSRHHHTRRVHLQCMNSSQTQVRRRSQRDRHARRGRRDAHSLTALRATTVWMQSTRASARASACFGARPRAPPTPTLAAQPLEPKRERRTTRYQNAILGVQSSRISKCAGIRQCGVSNQFGVRCRDITNTQQTNVKHTAVHLQFGKQWTVHHNSIRMNARYRCI